MYKITEKNFKQMKKDFVLGLYDVLEQPFNDIVYNFIFWYDDNKNITKFGWDALLDDDSYYADGIYKVLSIKGFHINCQIDDYLDSMNNEIRESFEHIFKDDKEVLDDIDAFINFRKNWFKVNSISFYDYLKDLYTDEFFQNFEEVVDVEEEE